MEIALIKSYTHKPWRSPETYQLIEDSLRERWTVAATEARQPEALHDFLEGIQMDEDKDLFVFNIAEYLDEEHKRGFLPELLEDWDLPHLGSSAEAVALGLDKAGTKAVLEQQGIPTPAYFVAEPGEPDLAARAEAIGYPLMVKPVGEGGHIGVSADSIVEDPAGLEAAVERVHAQYQQPALVEQYIGGPEMREFSVGLVDGDPPLVVPVEIDFDAMDLEVDILSYTAAQKDLERIKLVEEEEVRERIVDLARRTFEAVGARDYCRVDLRMDAKDCYVLEINVMPGLGPHSFLPEAAHDIYDLEYDQLIRRLVESSLRRQRVEET